MVLIYGKIYSKFPVHIGFAADLTKSEMRSVKEIAFQIFLPSQSRFYKIFHASEENKNKLVP